MAARGLGDQALAVEEAERQFLVVAGGPHRHRQRPAVDPDLERFLDRHLVGDAVVIDPPVHARIHARVVAGSVSCGHELTQA